MMKRLAVVGLAGLALALTTPSVGSHAEAETVSVNYVLSVAVLDLTTNPMEITAAPEYRVITIAVSGLTVNDPAGVDKAIGKILTDGVCTPEAVCYPAHRVQRVVLIQTTTTTTITAP